MNRNPFKAALLLLAALLLTTACTDATAPDDRLTSADTLEVKLTFGLSLNSRLQSRAAGLRPLESADDWQRVSSVRVFLFRSDTEGGTYTYYRPTLDETVMDYLYVPAFSGKATDQSGIWGDNEADWEQHAYSATKLKLQAGWYRFVAIGRDDINGDDDAGSLWDFTTLTEGTTTLTSLTATAKGSGGMSGGACCRELFFGMNEAPLRVSPLGGTEGGLSFYEIITLSRVVAGVLMYVENVTANEGGETVKTVGIVRREHTSGVNLSDKTAVGTTEVFLSAGEAIVGTTPSAKDYVVKCDIPAGAAVENGYYVSTNATSTAHPNSLYGGSFTTPQVAPSADCTLTFVYLNAAGKVLRARDIRLAADDTKTFPLLANHLYTIGLRRTADGTDEPIDLGADPTGDLIIAHGSWQAEVEIDL